jgi:hypothetical protein
MIVNGEVASARFGDEASARSASAANEGSIVVVVTTRAPEATSASADNRR